MTLASSRNNSSLINVMATVAIGTAAASVTLAVGAFIVRRQQVRRRHLKDEKLLDSVKKEADSYSRSKLVSKTTIHEDADEDEEYLDPGLLDLFTKATEQAKDMKISDNQDRLFLYGLYKQATLGDAHLHDPPNRLNLIASAKYAAWSKFRNTSKTQAMVQYLRALSTLQQSESVDVGGSQVTYSHVDTNTADIVYSESDGEDESVSVSPSVSTTTSGGMGLRPSTLQYGHSKALKKHELLDLVARNNIEDLKTALEKDDVAVNVGDECGQTPLHLAADRGFVECSKLLLESGADPNAADEDGISVLQTAVISYSAQAAANESAKPLLEIIRALIKAGADQNLADTDGDTPYELAKADGHRALLKLFKRQ